MTVGIVDQLETVQVDQEQGHLFAMSRRSRRRLLKLLCEHAPVGQLCQLAAVGQSPRLTV